MYVIFPAEQVVDLTLGIVTEPRHHGLLCPHHRNLLTDPGTEPNGPVHKQEEPQVQEQRAQSKTQQTKKEKRKTRRDRERQREREGAAMAAGGDATLRDLTHPALNDALRAHNAVAFKLVRTVSDFTQQLSQVYEQHAEELQLLVSSFRKRNAELRKERPACASSLFQTWETLLQEVEVDSQAHADIASILGRQVARPLLERTFHRKIQSRKVFTHRESFEVILAKAEDKLAKCRQDYKNAYLSYMSNPTNAAMATYLDCHNSYVQQLHATNGMLDQYHNETLPQLLQELEDVYSDLCTTLADSVLQGAEIISSRAEEQARRYVGVSSQCRGVSARLDVSALVHSLSPRPRPPPTHAFASPQPPPTPQPDNPDGTPNDGPPTPEQTPPPLFKNEIIVDRLASVSVRTRLEALRKEAIDLEQQMKQNQDALDTLLRIQQRSLESSLFNKSNELQEDISLKRFDLRVAQIHLGAVKAQKELFASKAESAGDAMRERKMSSSSTGSMKNKWLKAFKSLKASNTGESTLKETDKKNQMYHAVSAIMTMRKDAAAGTDGGSHSLQEYTYRKITPCDVCSQVLRGHTRQGLKCKVCKVNVHADCQERLGRCQPKSRLLRRQKSTSEIETRHADLPPDQSFGPGSAAGTRPFGQPLCLSETANENGSVSSTYLKNKTKRLSK